MTDERRRPGPSTRAIRAASCVPEVRQVPPTDLIEDFGQALEAARGA